MSREDKHLGRQPTLEYNRTSDQTVAILAVGNAAEWKQNGNRLQADGPMAFVSFEDINEPFLTRTCPSVVLSPVLARNFDCIDLAQILFSLGFTGRYRALSNELPNPDMVEREIRHLCPGLDFAILIDR